MTTRRLWTVVAVTCPVDRDALWTQRARSNFRFTSPDRPRLSTLSTACIRSHCPTGASSAVAEHHPTDSCGRRGSGFQPCCPSERSAEYRENPPPADWDGVYVKTTK